MMRETNSEDTASVLRLDKWLWAARFFKTRALAQQAIEAGRVLISGDRVKVARSLRVGELVTIRTGETVTQVHVRALSVRRGPAPEARLLYEETDASRADRETRAQARRISEEPAWSIDGGRPTKRDRRALERWRRSD